MRLTRDRVISVTEDGDRVGVFEEGTSGREPFFECDPLLADRLIALWNRSPYAVPPSDD